MLPIKYFFNPRGSARIDSWIRLLLTAQVLIQPRVNSYWRTADFFVLYEQFSFTSPPKQAHLVCFQSGTQEVSSLIILQ